MNKENQNADKTTIESLEERVIVLEEKLQKLVLFEKFYRLEKAWESSLVRYSYLGLSTYIFSALFLIIIEGESPFLSAFVPLAAVLASSVSFPYFKRLWRKYYFERARKQWYVFCLMFYSGTYHSVQRSSNSVVNPVVIYYKLSVKYRFFSHLERYVYLFQFIERVIYREVYNF